MRWRGLIAVVGVVQRKDTGRPEIAYGRRCKPQDIAHEVSIADIENCLGAVLTRGVKVGRTEPDGFMRRDGTDMAIEMDRSGKMTQKQMDAKWDRYRGFNGLILVVAMTESRMQRLRKGADAVKGQAMFTTLTRLKSGMSHPWIDCIGDPVSI